jgi:hypothetical protein
MQINSDQSLERGSAIYRHFGSWDAVRRAAQEKGWSYVLSSAGVPQADPEEPQTYTGRASVTFRQPDHR